MLHRSSSRYICLRVILPMIDNMHTYFTGRNGIVDIDKQVSMAGMTMGVDERDDAFTTLSVYSIRTKQYTLNILHTEIVPQDC